MKLPDPSAVIKVGEGRGFVIEQSVRVPIPSLREEEKLGLSMPSHVTRRLVITAAHCLPHLPPVASAAFAAERTYRGLLAVLKSKRRRVSAECLFADPVADIAVLGEPDAQGSPKQFFAYHELTEAVTPLQVGKAEDGPGWVLSRDGNWVPTRLELLTGLEIDAVVGGMSGSPILNRDGFVVGVVSIGAEGVHEGKRTNERAGPQPVLTRNLPGWLINPD